MEVHHLELLISCDLKNDELPQKMNSLTLKIACLEWLVALMETNQPKPPTEFSSVVMLIYLRLWFMGKDP